MLIYRLVDLLLEKPRLIGADMLLAHITSFDTPSLVFAVGIGFFAGVAMTLVATRVLSRRRAEVEA